MSEPVVQTRDVQLNEFASQLILEKLQELMYLMEAVRVPNLGAPERFRKLRVLVKDSPTAEHMLFLISTNNQTPE